MYYTKNDVTLFRPPSTKLLVTCENGRQKHNGGTVTCDTHCARTVVEWLCSASTVSLYRVYVHGTNRNRQRRISKTKQIQVVVDRNKLIAEK